MAIHSAQFVKAVTGTEGLPEASFPVVAFLGRSNVGKSSVINRLVRQKKLAYSSSMQGRTTAINYFLVNSSVYFVDLPGYGYAKVSKEERDRWGRLMEAFFAAEGLVTLGVMIVDARHKPTADDCTMASWFLETGCPMVVIANKSDKLKKSEIEPNLALIRETLGLPDEVRVILFSAEKGTGAGELMGEILRFVK